MKKLRVDVNQKEIIAFFRERNCSVVDLHAVGKGCPDLLVAISNQNILVEVKTEKGKLTPAQIKFHETWNAPIEIIRNKKEAQNLLEKYNVKS
jgi:Holliday junction resolvase